MKKKFFLTTLAAVMTIGTGTGFAQMMGSGQHMYGGQGTAPGPEMMEGAEQQAAPPAQQKNYPYQMYPGMMGPGYGGYGMGPGMMGQGYGGYGMGPGMMGGYGMGPGMMGYGGYGMGPGMMGGYGMGPGMMGYGGYGMGPGMMGHGYGMGPGMMGGYGMMGPGKWGGSGGWHPGAAGESAEKHNKALDETQELRRKMHSLQFEYGEALRNPEISDEKKKEMAAELFEVHEKIRQKMHQ